MKNLIVVLCFALAFLTVPAGAVESSSRFMVEVVGAVGQPGSIFMNEQDGLLVAILRAGGLKPGADGRHVVVRFKNGGEQSVDVLAIIKKASKDQQLHDGDVVIVKKNGEPNQTLEPTAPSGRGSS